jgi:2-polyprenyl-3-methyl-5-hydroxy-6-metoxy-1,4-benzoquinol methylase
MRRGPIDNAVGYFSHNAREFDDLYRAQPGFYQERLQIWRSLLDRYARPETIAIDLGCGSGIFSFYLAEHVTRVTALDGAPDMVTYCESQRQERGLSNVTFFQAELPGVDEKRLGTADLLISSSVVEYVEDLDATLALIARVLRPNGIAILSMPNRMSISRNYQRLRYRLTGEPEIYRYIRHFSSPGLLRRQLHPFGFRLLESHYYTHTTRVAQLTRALHLPETLTEDLFVAVFQKG